MSTISLEALKVDTVIGVYAWEQRIHQAVSIDLEMSTNSAAAAASDDIADALDYKAIAKRVMRFTAASRFALLETLAEKIADLVIEEFAVTAVKVSVSKPKAVRGAENVRIIVEKSARE